MQIIFYSLSELGSVRAHRAGGTSAGIIMVMDQTRWGAAKAPSLRAHSPHSNNERWHFTISSTGRAGSINGRVPVDTASLSSKHSEPVARRGEYDGLGSNAEQRSIKYE